MRVKFVHILSALLILAALPAAYCFGQDIQSLGDFSGRGGFYIDYAQFRSGREGFDRMEIYYKIFNRNLQFIKRGDNYRADYELDLTVYDKDDRQVTASSRDRSITATDYRSITNSDDFRVGMFDLLLPAGKYKIEMKLLDKNSGNTSQQDVKAELENYDNREPMLSGIEFAQVIDSGVADTTFAKNDITIIPSVTRIYAGDSTAFLKYYYEIYQGSKERREAVIETQLLDEKMDIVFRDSLTAEFAEGENIIHRDRTLPLTGYNAGDYTLQIILRNRQQRAVAQQKEVFSIYWPPEAMVLNDYDKAIKQLKYIASKEEINKLKSAKTPQERLEYWNAFWQARDPSPGTPENEAKRDYYDRIEYANRYFGVLRKEGWRTDRGMILIKYGVPDRIEDYPFELDSKAYVIWYYYRYKEPREFLFVDEWGDGDYQLQYPYDGKM